MFDFDSINIAEDGMYVSDNSVYVIHTFGDDFNLYKNGILKYKGNSPVYKKFNSSGCWTSLTWCNGKGKSSPVSYIKCIDKETLLLGMEILANDCKKEYADYYAEKFNYYQQNIMKLLDNNVNELLDFQNFEKVNNSNYLKYEKKDYALMSMYLDTAKYLGEDVYNKFVNNNYIKGILYNMSFDHNGICTIMEKKIDNQNFDSKKI